MSLNNSRRPLEFNDGQLASKGGKVNVIQNYAVAHINILTSCTTKKTTAIFFS